MIEISAKTKFNAAPDAVWRVIGDPGAISSWHPGVAESSLEGTGAGATRRCTLANGAKLVERIEAHNEARRSYTYSITDSPLPISNYRATLTVEQADGGCEVEWRGEFEPTGGADPSELGEMIKGIYEGGLAALKDSLGE